MYILTSTSAADAAAEAASAAAESVSEAASRLEQIADFFIEKLSGFGSNLLTAGIVALAGWYIIKLIVKAFSKILFKSKLDDSVASFLSSLISMTLKVILIITVITTLGVQMSSIVALVGSAGLAIGLALQGCLSNFAGGVLILVLKPFKVGDYIIDGIGNEGTVTNIDIIYTKLLTADNRAVIVPNGSLANATLINVTQEDTRRIDFNVSVDYSEDIDKVKGILLELAEKDDFVLKDQDYLAFVNKFDPSAINMTLRVWVSSENYWTAKAEIQVMIKIAFDRNNIVIPYDKLDVNVINSK